MKFIRFTERRVITRPGNTDLVFEKDSVHELVDPSANRWLKRGVAVLLTAAEVKTHKAAARKAAKAAAAGNGNGDTVDGTQDVAGQDRGGHGERPRHDAGGGGFRQKVRRLFGGD